MRFILIIILTIGVLGSLASQDSNSVHPTLVIKSKFKKTIKVSEMKAITEEEWKEMIREGKEKVKNSKRENLKSQVYEHQDDPVLQDFMPPNRGVSNTLQTFEGANCAYYPSDANGSVNADYYVQAVNSTFSIYNKTGTLQNGPIAINTLFTGLPGGSYNDGDPIVLYDEQANRWLMCILSVSGDNDYLLIAVSQSDNPLGAWNSYSFDVDDMPDYPKIGIWNDAYYIGIDKLSNGTQDQEDVFAIERQKMIDGKSAQIVGFINPDRPNLASTIAAPVDNEGAFAEANSPGVFVAINHNQWNNIKDQLWIYEMSVDWNNPLSSTFSRTQTLDVAAFTPGSDPTQPAGYSLEALSRFIMNKPVYRNFSNHEALVCCHTVEGSSSTITGIRWYELRKTESDWEIRQQGTYSPDSDDRWEASITMNSNHRIAMGYSVTGNSTYPGIRYAAQSPSAYAAANGILDITEATILDGSGLQSGSVRWGDYTNISVDPSNDSIFWYTNQYVVSGSHRNTKISKFSFGPFGLTADFVASSQQATVNETMIQFSDISYGTPSSWQWSFSPSTVSYVGGTGSTSQNPEVKFTAAGTYNVSLEVADGVTNNLITKTAHIVVNPDCSVSGFPWTEGFENSGNIPQCWTQEYQNLYNEDWQFVTGDDGSTGTHNTAHTGTYNAFFEKDNAVTLLISPELDLSGLTNPQLSFWYVQDGTTDNFDDFKLLYRPTANDAWTTIRTYNQKKSNWTADTVVLPGNSATANIAFKSNSYSYNGYGVLIDDIKIEEKTQDCASPIITWSDPSSTSAQLNWTFPVGSPTAEIYWGLKGDIPGGSGDTIKSILASTYNLSGLSAETEYDWFVRSVCGTDTSSWTGPVSFTTIGTALSMPVQEDFESGFVKFVNSSSNNADFTISTSLQQSGSKSAQQNPTQNNISYLETSSFFDLTSTAFPMLTFWHIAAIQDGDDICKVQISTDNGTSWQTLPTKYYEGSSDNYSSYQKFNTNSYSSWNLPATNSMWKKEIYSLNNYKAEQVRLRFYLSSDHLDISTDSWSIDNIVIEDAACAGIEPDSPFTSEINSSSAKLNWTERGSATTWDIEYGPAGFNQGNGTTITAATSNPYSLTGLSASTSYDWYVRSSCGASTYSEWRGPESFTTTCLSSNLPYFEDFEGVTAPALPSCFNAEDKNNDGTVWQTNTWNYFSGSKSAGVATPASRAANDWMFTPGFNLVQGTSYQLAFVYATVGGHESFEIKYGDYPNAESMYTASIYTNNDITNWSWQMASVNFTPSTTGVYYFGFHAMSPMGTSGFNIDDIYLNVNSNTAEWSGALSNDWYNAANWNNDTIPTASTSVSILPNSTYFPTLDKLSIADTLNLKSSSAGNASLMGEEYFKSPNDIIMEQYFSGGKWHLMSASVDTVTLNDLYFNNNPDVWIKKYNEADDSWTFMSSLNTQLPIGWGYAVWVEAGNNATATFRGSLNSSDVYLSEWDTPPLSWSGATHGYNLVGNPFASALDWDTGNWDTTNIEGSIWVWSDAAGNYLYRNSQGQGSLTNGIIPRGQGFFIRAKSTDMYFTIPMDARTHSNQNFYKKSDNSSSFAVIRGEKDNDKLDEVWVSFSGGASNEFDHGFDVEKLFSEGDSPEIYLNFDNENYSLLALPELFLETRIINMNYKAGENGEQKITLKQTENMDYFDILLEDTKLNIFTDLKKEGSYNFQATTYQNPDRFKLHFTSYITNVNVEENIDNILVYSNNSKVFINRKGEYLKTNIQIDVFDIMGIKTASVLSNDKLIIIDNLKTNNYYLLKLKSHGKTVVKKVFVR